MGETLSLLAQGFGVALQPGNIALCLVGAAVGTLVGVLPGLGPVATMALLLPLTYSMGPTGALIMFAGIYYGAMYGGSNLDPAQHPRRGGFGVHADGGIRDGAPGPRGTGPGNGGV